MIKLYAAKISDRDDGYVTGEFDRCFPPSLYMDNLKNSMLFGEAKDVVEFMKTFEYSEGCYKIECFELRKIDE